MDIAVLMSILEMNHLVQHPVWMKDVKYKYIFVEYENMRTAR